MPTSWQTYPVQFKGGWITNLSRLEQGSTQPGSATILQNFEPAVDTGYQRIRGYTEFSDTVLPGDEVQERSVIIVTETEAIAYRDGRWWLGAGGSWTDKGASPSLIAARTRSVHYNFNGTDKVMIVDGVNKPAIYDTVAKTVTYDTSAPSDVQGASNVALFSQHLFLAKGNMLTFLAPFTDTDYDTGNGAGSINVGGPITGLIVFRNQLIVFQRDRIGRVVGDTEANFELQPIANNIGCLCPHTVQEVGGDILYLGPDGIRWLSATEKNNDFGLERASSAIQDQINAVINSECGYASMTIRSKNQYRLFSFLPNVNRPNSKGFIATQFMDQSAQNIEWAETRGMKVYAVDSRQFRDREIILFISDTGYVYRMEVGNSFDGEPIPFVFETPYMPLDDPKLRKTIYKHTVYIRGLGQIALTCQLKFDYGVSNKIQPPPFDLISGDNGAFYYGALSSLYGTAVYSVRPLDLFFNNTIGAGFVVSIKYSGTSAGPPFLMENMILEYATNERR